MKGLGTLRGHPVYTDAEGVWRFSDTGEPTVETWQDRPCGVCGQYQTPEGHDPCLGTLPGVRNACCGHGDREAAYIQFDNGVVIRGFDVVEKDDMTEWCDDEPNREIEAPDMPYVCETWNPPWRKEYHESG